MELEIKLFSDLLDVGSGSSEGLSTPSFRVVFYVSVGIRQYAPAAHSWVVAVAATVRLYHRVCF